MSPRKALLLTASAAVFAAFAGGALAQDRGDPARGYAYASRNCTECHEIEAGHYDSPRLEAPPFEDIANARGMSEIALFPFFQTAHVSMPLFVVAPDDIRDLTAYILSLRE